MVVLWLQWGMLILVGQLTQLFVAFSYIEMGAYDGAVELHHMSPSNLGGI